MIGRLKILALALLVITVGCHRTAPAPVGATGLPNSITPLYFAGLTTSYPFGTRDTGQVDGCVTAGDGCAGHFDWNATSTGTPDSGTIVQVTGVSTGRWIRRYSGALNVKWFGAKGDGKRFADGVISSGSHNLTSGTYQCSAADLGKLITVYGAGAAGSILQTSIASCSGTTFVLTATAGTTVGSAGEVNYGTDDHVAISATITAAAVSAYGSTIYFPPGVYCTSVGFHIDNSAGMSGLKFVGASQGAEGASLTEPVTRIVLMTAQSYLMLHTAYRTRFTDIWFDGNFLAMSVVEFAYFSVENHFESCFFSGAAAGGNVHYYSNRNGQYEIDFLDFHRVSLVNDPWLATRYAARVVYNVNADAFFIKYDASEFRYGTTIWECSGGGEDVYDSQVFGWTNAAIQVDTFCQPSTFAKIYNEGDTAYFLKSSFTAAVTSSLTLTLRDIQLNSTAGVYWNHSMRLKLENVSIGTNIISDPANAVGFNGTEYGVQPIVSVNTTFVNSHLWQLNSGNGSLIEESGTIVSQIAPTTITDATMNDAGYLTSNSGPFTKQSVGLPVTVNGAGTAGGSLGTFVAKYLSANVVQLVSPAVQAVADAGATFGGQQLEGSHPGSPYEMVNVNTGYDNNNCVLALGSGQGMQVPDGGIVPAYAAADTHYVSLLTANRTCVISTVGLTSVGVHMRVSRYGATDPYVFTVDFDALNSAHVGLAANQWAEFEYINNNGWVLFSTNGTVDAGL